MRIAVEPTGTDHVAHRSENFAVDRLVHLGKAGGDHVAQHPVDLLQSIVELVGHRTDRILRVLPQLRLQNTENLALDKIVDDFLADVGAQLDAWNLREVDVHSDCIVSQLVLDRIGNGIRECLDLRCHRSLQLRRHSARGIRDARAHLRKDRIHIDERTAHLLERGRIDHVIKRGARKLPCDQADELRSLARHQRADHFFDTCRAQKSVGIGNERAYAALDRRELLIGQGGCRAYTGGSKRVIDPLTHITSRVAHAVRERSGGIRRCDLHGGRSGKTIKIVEQLIDRGHDRAVDDRGDEFFQFVGKQVLARIDTPEQLVRRRCPQRIDHVLGVTDPRIERAGGKARDIELRQTVVFETEGQFRRIGAKVFRAVRERCDEEVLGHIIRGKSATAFAPAQAVVESVCDSEPVLLGFHRVGLLSIRRRLPVTFGVAAGKAGIPRVEENRVEKSFSAIHPAGGHRIERGRQTRDVFSLGVHIPLEVLEKRNIDRASQIEEPDRRGTRLVLRVEVSVLARSEWVGLVARTRQTDRGHFEPRVEGHRAAIRPRGNLAVGPEPQFAPELVLEELASGLHSQDQKRRSGRITTTRGFESERERRNRCIVPILQFETGSRVDLGIAQAPRAGEGQLLKCDGEAGWRGQSDTRRSERILVEIVQIRKFESREGYRVAIEQ